MNETILDLIALNPSGLMELQSPLTTAQYRENFGFKLKNVVTIFQSRRLNGKDTFAFPNKSLENLLEFKESGGDLLVVYIVETIENNKIHCNLVLSNDAYQKLLSKKDSIIQVHQMYSEFFKDHVALNYRR